MLTTVDLSKNDIKIIMLPKYSQKTGFVNRDGNIEYEYGTMYHIGAQINPDIFIDVCQPGKTKEEAIVNFCLSLKSVDVPYDKIDIDGFNPHVYSSVVYYGC